MKVSGIYKITNTLDNKFYIGSSIDIEKRWYDHKRDLKNNKHHSVKLQRSWNKYGESHFKFEIVELCEPIRDTLLMIEQKYLDLKPYFNCYYCSTSPLGYKHSEETKRKYSETRRGKNNPRYGIPLSEEGRRKISEASKNRIIKNSTRLKMSISSLDSEWNKIQRRPIVMIDIITNNIVKEFNSVCSAAIYTGHINHRVGIKRCANSEQVKAYGYKWRFKNDI